MLVPKIVTFPLAVLDIYWISTYVFAVVFAAADGSLEIPPDLVIVSLAKKDEKREDQFLNFNDLCFGVSTERQHHYYLQYYEDWDLVLASSAASIEVSIVARQPDKVNWELWGLEDAARAEFPVNENSDDTMPVGIGIDITSQLPITSTDEKIEPPAPVLMMLSTDGLLCPFHMINTIPGVKTVFKSPKCPHMDGERVPKPAQTSITAPSILVPTRAATAQPRDSSVVVQPKASLRPSILPVILPSLPFFPKVPAPTKDLANHEPIVKDYESSSSSDSQHAGTLTGQRFDLSPTAASGKFVRFLNLGTPTSSSETEISADSGEGLSSLHSSGHAATAAIRSALGSAAVLTVPKTCPTQASESLDLSVSDLEKQLQQLPTLDPVMSGIMEEIALFQKELDDLKARTAGTNFEVGSAKEMSHLKFDAEMHHTFLLKVKETTESLHGDIGTLKTVMLEGFAAVEDATTHNERSIDQNYLQLLRRKPLDPKSEAQLKVIRHLHQYVKFAVQDVNDVLDMEWEQYQEKNKKHKHLLLPEREVLFNALSSHHEIINQQDKKIDELINSLQNLRIYNQTSKWCVPDDKCLQSDQCWAAELEMLRNVLVKTTLDGVPKVPSCSPGKLSPVKQSQLRNFLSKRQTPPVRSTAPANLSRSAFMSPKCYGELEEVSQASSASPRLAHEGLQTEEQEEEVPSFKHSPVTRLPSFPPALITASSTPFSKIQPAGSLPASAVPKPMGKTVKHGAPGAEKPATSIPAAQAAAQAAFRRQMTSQAPVPSAALTEPVLKDTAPTINTQFLKDIVPHLSLSTIIRILQKIIVLSLTEIELNMFSPFTLLSKTWNFVLLWMVLHFVNSHLGGTNAAVVQVGMTRMHLGKVKLFFKLAAAVDHLGLNPKSPYSPWHNSKGGGHLAHRACAGSVVELPNLSCSFPIDLKMFLFNSAVYVNDLDSNVGGMVKKFADDTKIGCLVDSEEGNFRLQEAIDCLVHWTERWKMEFSPEKCEIYNALMLACTRDINMQDRDRKE
ncbi:nuclear pore complex protein Nup214-like [Heterodontus francisci]|uniref:nuclear pore complex protein Nup214-like n=1 Tax=Heterodontus francisci TaxID=7792 RepID=UPI00355AF949